MANQNEQAMYSENRILFKIAKKYSIAKEDDTRTLSQIELRDQSNTLRGCEIPIQIATFNCLTTLALPNNQLRGIIPEEIVSLTKLEFLDLSNNELSGCIPRAISSLTNLLYLDLSKNQLSGIFPTEIGALSKLKILYFANNQLSGSIPKEIANLTQLKCLSLQNNQLSGSIPEEIAALPNLLYLLLNDNQLCGIVPEFGKQLAYLTVGENYFSEFASEESKSLAENYAPPQEELGWPEQEKGIANWNKIPEGEDVSEELGELAESLRMEYESVISQLKMEIKQYKENQVTRTVFVAKLQEKIQEMQSKNALEIENWELKKVIAGKISKLSQLDFNNQILGSGCDGIVFLCSVEGIGDVALKMVFNIYDVESKNIPEYYGNEFNLLKSLPIHKNIIPILCEFTDRPSDRFFEHIPPDIQKYTLHLNGQRRKTQCILMPSLTCFASHMKHHFHSTSIGQKLEFIANIVDGLLFLFENDVVHLDMKLNNLLINSFGRVIICDFGHAKKLNPQKQAYLLSLSSLGGNPQHLAPEIKLVDNGVAQWVDFSKQPSFELGMLAHEIIFGETPERLFGEEMDDSYFRSICPDDSHNNGKLFGWVKGLLMKDKGTRAELRESAKMFEEIIGDQRLKDFIAEFQTEII